MPNLVQERDFPKQLLSIHVLIIIIKIFCNFTNNINGKCFNLKCLGHRIGSMSCVTGNIIVLAHSFQSIDA